jgi:E3 ubiquitin-protein ligase RNF1/2
VPIILAPGQLEGEYVLEGLTAYDMHREPRALVVDDRSKSVPINQVSQSLTCPVCRELPTRTMTVMKCLHRFCAECIDSSLRLG